MAIKLRTVLFFLVVFAVLLFAAVNWPVFMQMSQLNLLVARVTAPLGVVMLAILGGITLFYLLLLAKSETESLVGSRRASREVDEARKLALSAEESRITELREEVRENLSEINEKVAEILRRIDAQGRIAVRHETTVVPETLVGTRNDII